MCDKIRPKNKKTGGNMKKAVIFDLDGTVVDSVGAIASCANERLKEAGLCEQPVEKYKYFAGDGQYELIKRALAASGDIELLHYDEVMKSYIEHFKDTCHIGCKPYPGITGMLTALKKDNIRIAVLSNKAHANTIKVIEYVFGKDYFDYVQGQIEGINRKPSPDGVYMVMDKLNVSREECIYVGDTSVDMKTGKAAGLYTVGVTWGFRDREELIANHADAIIDRPEELLKYIYSI